MLLRDLLRDIRIVKTTADLSISVTDVTNDSRSITPGAAFVCIAGNRFDGHDYGARALRAGAAVVITQRELGLPSEVVIEDTRAAYPVLCSNYNGNPASRMKMIAVTGTNGKTTVTYIIKHILEECGCKVGLIGTIENYIGDVVVPAKHTTPDPAQLHLLLARMERAGCEYVVLEASSHALDQHRLDGILFDVAIFTNFTQDHLDYHKTMEAYYEAKRKLFFMAKRGIINLDDPVSERLLHEIPCPVMTYSTCDNRADFTAKEIQSSAQGVRFMMVGEAMISRVKFLIPGLYSVSNALAAACCCVSLGFPLEQVTQALGTCRGVRGRMEVLPTQTPYTVIRDYAHTPDGLSKVLAAFREFFAGRLTVLFGAAGNRDRGKRPEMAHAVAQYADFAVVTSDNPRGEDPQQIISDVLPGFEGSGCPYIAIVDRREAIRWALAHAQEGEILLLAGKGHEDYQVIADCTISFDEAEVVQELLAEQKGGDQTGTTEPT